MANSSKAKGDRAELEVQGLLRDTVRPCKRCGEPYRRDLAKRGEYCSRCRRRVVAAKAASRRARNAEREYTGLEPWHGTGNGYTNYRCRCAKCWAAEKAYRDEWRKRPDVAERIRVRSRIASKRPERRLKEKARQYNIDQVTLGGYLADGICFACGAQNPERGLYVDHDHTCCPSFRKVCGECVRGLLCRDCNQTLGIVKDRREHLQALIDYLDRWEARRASQ